MNAEAEASRSPQVGSLTTQVEQLLHKAAQAAVEQVSAQYEEGLTKQVAILTVENDRLTTEIGKLRERLQAFVQQSGSSAPVLRAA